jgi:hypothetical protein
MKPHSDSGNQGYWRLIEFPTIEKIEGCLTFAEGAQLVPFEIRRVYYIYRVPEGAVRSGHAHRSLEQVLVPVAGRFDAVVDDGARRQTISLAQENVGLYISKMVWRRLENFSSGAVCLALASTHYDEYDYIRNYGDFVTEVKQR